MSICECFHPVSRYPALGVKGGQGGLVQVLAVYVVPLRPKDVHAVVEGVIPEETFFVLLMSYMLLDHRLSDPLAFLIFPPSASRIKLSAVNS